jgi:hypothetical protein
MGSGPASATEGWQFTAREAFMKTLVLAWIVGSGLMFGQVVEKSTESTTVTQHHGKDTKTDTKSTTTAADATGTTTDTTNTTTKTKKKHGKAKTTTTTSDSHSSDK